jgi:hypothetical protein
MLYSHPADPPQLRHRWPKPRKVVIGRTTPPVNVIGGYRFPGAPEVDLRPSAPAKIFKRIHGAERVPA